MNNLERLGKLVRLRREALGLSQIEVWKQGGPSNSTLTKIESNTYDSDQQPSAASLRKLDIALQWEAGSAKRILDGGEPTAVEDSTPWKNTLADATYSSRIEGSYDDYEERVNPEVFVKIENWIGDLQERVELLEKMMLRMRAENTPRKRPLETPHFPVTSPPSPVVGLGRGPRLSLADYDVDDSDIKQAAASSHGEETRRERLTGPEPNEGQ